MIGSYLKEKNAVRAARKACGNSTCKGCPFIAGAFFDGRVCEVCRKAYIEGFAKGVKWTKAVKS